MKHRSAALAAALCLASLCLAGGSGAAVTRHDADGTVLIDGVRSFPIVLAKGPPRDGLTPTGANALDEVISAGVTFLKVGPANTVWTAADIEDARLWNRAAAARGAHTWVNLSTISRASPGSSEDKILEQAISTLKADAVGWPALGMWKGADEPWWSHYVPESLRFVYCRSTSRGGAGWCDPEPWLDQDHVWVTIEAPRGTAADLAPYSAVTDAHGVDIYPVTLATPTPDLHQVGRWTDTIASVTPGHAVWTTLQVCASGSYDGTGRFVLPSREQERYMIYDAIINGARTVAFYGGNIAGCWSASDAAVEWNWTFWNGVLKGLIREINAISPVAPALVNAATTRTVTTSDPTTQAISRAGSASDELWVFAARSGAGTQPVTVTGLPPTITSGEVYTEGRSVAVTNGSFTDSFPQWGVHVYRFRVPTAPSPLDTTIDSAANGAFTFHGTSSAVGFECAVDGGAFASCTSPVSYALPPGTHGFAVRAVDGSGARDASPATATWTVAAAPPPPPPAGAGGGGGGSAGAPDLSLTLEARGTPRAVGDGFLYRISVSEPRDVDVLANDVTLTFRLPPQAALVSSRVSRGSGCAGTTTLTCNLGFVTQQVGSEAEIAVSVQAPGDLVAEASVTNAYGDRNPADNAASLTVSIPVAQPAPAATPRAPSTVLTRRGTAAGERLVGTGGADVLLGLGGNDVLSGLSGNDRLYGGPGADRLLGGPGADLLSGGDGADRLESRDGSRDVVECGRGRDLVLADRRDRVARSCERVLRR